MTLLNCQTVQLWWICSASPRSNWRCTLYSQPFAHFCRLVISTAARIGFQSEAKHWIPAKFTQGYLPLPAYKLVANSFYTVRSRNDTQCCLKHVTSSTFRCTFKIYLQSCPLILPSLPLSQASSTLLFQRFFSELKPCKLTLWCHRVRI